MPVKATVRLSQQALLVWNQQLWAKMTQVLNLNDTYSSEHVVFSFQLGMLRGQPSKRTIHYQTQ